MISWTLTHLFLDLKEKKQEIVELNKNQKNQDVFTTNFRITVLPENFLFLFNIVIWVIVMLNGNMGVLKHNRNQKKIKIYLIQLLSHLIKVFKSSF